MPIGQHVLVKVEEGELHPRDNDRLPVVAPPKLELEGRFVNDFIIAACCTTLVVVGSIQVDLRELSEDFSLQVMISTVRIVVIRDVLDVQVDLRGISIWSPVREDRRVTLGGEDVSEDCARRATR